MGIQEYLALDLIEASKKLDARLESESGRAKLELSDIVGTQPGNLTPNMEAWYQGTVAPLRLPALSELSQMFRERLPGGEEQGFLLERELAHLENEFAKSKRDCHRKIGEKYRVQIQEIGELTRSIADRNYQYRTRKAALGRDAKLLNRALYGFGLLLILVTESFINFASFSALSWATPFIATGSTLIVAALVTLAAHLHGSALKQYEYYFGEAARDNVRYAGYRHLAIGFAALLVALLFVYYARSAYLAVYLASLGAFGLSGQGHSPLWIIGGSLLGNVAVYLAGTGLAYLVHDPDPDFPRLKEALNKDDRQCKKLSQLVNSETSRRLNQIEEEWKKNVAETRRANATFINRPFFSNPRTMLAAFQAKDEAVIEILSSYRGRLLDKARKDGTLTDFIAPSDEPQRPLTWESSFYERQPLKLKFLEE